MAGEHIPGLVAAATASSRERGANDTRRCGAWDATTLASDARPCSAPRRTAIPTPPAAPPRALARALAAALALAGIGAVAPAAHAADPVDATLDRTQAVAAPPAPATARAQQRLRDGLGPNALVERDPASGTPKVVARLDGHLTPRSDRAAADLALGYVRDHLTAFGLDADDLADLRLASRTRDADGTVHLRWQQTAGGIPHVDGGLQAAVDGDGRLINVTGGPLPDAAAATTEPAIGARRALEAALPGTAPAPPAGIPRGPERRTEFLRGGRASLVLYRDGGDDRLGWRVLAADGSQAFYDAIVDARTGRLVRRVNRVRSARIRHFDVNPRADGTTNSELTEIPDRWLITDERLEGPYAHVVSDPNDEIRLEQSPTGYVLDRPPGPGDEVPPTSQSPDGPVWDQPPRFDFCTASFACSWSPGNVLENREFSAAQLFWYVNTIRDHLASAPISFSGPESFEDDDAVLAQTLDGATTLAPRHDRPDAAHVSNASMLVLPDGYPGIMQVHLFNQPVYGRYDGAMDAGLVYHEYTHGLSERLVTDAQGFGALIEPQSWAIAEGTSDFYALDFLVETQPGLVPDSPAPGEVRMGAWLQLDPQAKGVSAFRTEGLDCAIGSAAEQCPGGSASGPGGYDFSDFGKVDSGPEPHADGEIWGQALWSLRAALIERHGVDEGLARTRAYVTGGLRLSPADPTFLDMRNAIVQAAVAQHGTDDWQTLWQAFAGRGMGWSASTEGPADTAPVAATDVPQPPVGPPPAPAPTPTPTATPAPTVTPPPPPPPPPPPRPAKLLDTKLRATRSGKVKVGVFLGDKPPAGTARIRLMRKRKAIAQATVAVRNGATVKKTLRLTRKGRQAIRPGKSGRVTVELRLPGGQKVTKTVKLARSRR